jgi:tetrahydromethanopterin S-methyltransferase subunit D
MYQTCNVGGADKAMRMAIGFGAAAYALLAEADATKKVSAGAVSAIALSTAFSGYCPLNALMGVDTCHKKIA